MEPQRLDTRVEIKAVDTAQRLIDGYAAAIGNKDRVGDIIDSAAFVRTLKENDDVLVFIGHDASRLPVGEPVSMRTDTKGLLTQTRVYNTPAGDELLEVAKQRMQSGRTLGMSIGYRVVKDRYSGGARHLLDVDLLEYSFLASPVLAANPEAVMVGVKGRKATGVGPVITTDDSYEELREDLAQAAAVTLGRSYVSVCATFSDHVIVAAYGYQDDERHYWDIPYTLNADGEPEMGDASEVDPAFVPAAAKARATFDKELPVKVWTLEMKAALPDTAFAFIEPGGTKDDGGLTMPRASRHFAHHNEDGSLNVDALKEALSESRKSAHGRAGLAHLLIHVKGDNAHAAEWSEGAIVNLVIAHAELGELLDVVAGNRKAMDQLGHDSKGGERLNQVIQTRLKTIEGALGRIREQAEAIDRGEDGTAQIDLYRYAFQLLDLEEVA